MRIREVKIILMLRIRILNILFYIKLFCFENS